MLNVKRPQSTSRRTHTNSLSQTQTQTNTSSTSSDSMFTLTSNLPAAAAASSSSQNVVPVTATATATASSENTNDIYGDDMDDDSSLEFESDSEQSYSTSKNSANTNTTNTNTTTASLNTIQPLTVNTTATAAPAISNEVGRIKSKINPFMPSTIKPRMSFERRRWAHIFPLRSDGTIIFPNWTQVKTNSNLLEMNPPLASDNNSQAQISNHISPPLSKISPLGTANNSGGGIGSIGGIGGLKMGRQASGGANSTNKIAVINKENFDTMMGSNENLNLNSANSAYNLMMMMSSSSNGGGGMYSATMKTGVAWKSLTMPACLPLTTDCCPSKKRWNNNFSLLSHYRLLLGESCV